MRTEGVLVLLRGEKERVCALEWYLSTLCQPGVEDNCCEAGVALWEVVKQWRDGGTTAQKQGPGRRLGSCLDDSSCLVLPATLGGWKSHAHFTVKQTKAG